MINHVAARLLALTLLFTSPLAGAGPPANDEGGNLNPDPWPSQGWYALASPGLITLDLVDGEDINPSYQWGLGLGHLGHFGETMALSIAFSFEHCISDVEIGSYHRFRFGPEVRLGLRSDRMFVYGLAGLSLGIHHARVDFEVLGVRITESDSEAGFAAAVGGGAEIQITDQFGAGAELQLDVEKAFQEDANVLLPLQIKIYGTVRL